MRQISRIFLARLLIAAVLLWNVQCALAFLLSPEGYAPAFALEGVAGAAAVRGVGVLFLMWNVPYAVALADPRKHRLSLYEAVAMQAIGVIGESWIAASLPGGYALLAASLGRFIAFDAAGLALLAAAAWISARQLESDRQPPANSR